VRSSPSHQARIRLSPESIWDQSNPWWGSPEALVAPEEEIAPDVLFLAGMDWRALTPAQRSRSQVPIINLVQDFRAVREDGPLRDFLSHRAIRICVSEQIAEALGGRASPDAPILTVPIGIDLEQLPPARPAEERTTDCVLLAFKEPLVGRAIARRLTGSGHRVRLLDRPVSRVELLEAIADARVSVHLPASIEGAYMPALESMALDTVVVCPDAVGNRGFCRDGETCLVPRRSKRAIVRAALRALRASPEDLQPMLAGAREEAMRRGLADERARFLEILGRAKELWE
jgi:glycosyltransferase involved in cell wall biosynthesis